MNHRQFKEWLPLYVIGELGPAEQPLYEAHLRECAGCRTELAEMKQLMSMIARDKPAEVDDRLLQEARAQLRSTLTERRLRPTFLENMREFMLGFAVREYRYALGGIAMLLLGLIAGYGLFYHPQTQGVGPISIEQPFVRQAAQPGGQNESFTQGNTRTSNVHLIDSDANDGVIDFTFDAVTPMHVRGNINDDKIQRVLARALTTEENPGVRLQTVNAIASQPHAARDCPPAEDPAGTRRWPVAVSLHAFQHGYDCSRRRVPTECCRVPAPAFTQLVSQRGIIQ